MIMSLYEEQINKLMFLMKEDIKTKPTMVLLNVYSKLKTGVSPFEFSPTEHILVQEYLYK